MHNCTYLRFLMLYLTCLEWNCNPSEKHLSNRVFYDMSTDGDFFAGAGFVSVFIL